MTQPDQSGSVPLRENVIAALAEAPDDGTVVVLGVVATIPEIEETYRRRAAAASDDGEA